MAPVSSNWFLDIRTSSKFNSSSTCMWHDKNTVNGFWFSRLTAALLTVAYDRFARAFNRSGATQGMRLDISKASKTQIIGVRTSVGVL